MRYVATYVATVLVRLYIVSSLLMSIVPAGLIYDGLSKTRERHESYLENRFKALDSKRDKTYVKVTKNGIDVYHIVATEESLSAAFSKGYERCMDYYGTIENTEYGSCYNDVLRDPGYPLMVSVLGAIGGSLVFLLGAFLLGLVLRWIFQI